MRIYNSHGRGYASRVNLRNRVLLNYSRGPLDFPQAITLAKVHNLLSYVNNSCLLPVCQESEMRNGCLYWTEIIWQRRCYERL